MGKNKINLEERLDTLEQRIAALEESLKGYKCRLDDVADDVDSCLQVLSAGSADVGDEDEVVEEEAPEDEKKSLKKQVKRLAKHGYSPSEIAEECDISEKKVNKILEKCKKCKEEDEE